MADSFYGGKPGFSFIIVKTYESIDEMISYFQQGPDYEAVHFDEHVLINTENKNDPDNGKIFRRGYDYSNDMGGAIYIGTIVGPAGRAPMLEMTTVDDVVSRQAEEGYDYRFSEGEYAPLYNLVPGKTDDGEYRDSIKWACCSVRNENNSDTTAWIGFIFPYLVVDYDADTVSAYYNRDSEEAGFTNTDLVDRMDDESHPYWEKWHISVPKGIKGDTFENFRVIKASDDDNVEPYDGQDDDRANAREILVYDYYHYDKEEGGEPVTIYLGDYNMITGITIDDDGTITIEYSHDDTLQYPNLFKWIKEVTIDLETGLFQVIYNYDNEPDGTPTIYQTYLDWVQDITMTHEGVVTIHYPNPEYDHDLDEIIKWVDEITFDQDGTLSIYYNTGEEVHWNNQVKWITEVGLTDDGDFHISFNNGDDDYTTHLTWVNDIIFESDGTISVHYNDGTDDFTYKNLIQWITNVSLSDDGHFVISFNNGTDDYETDLVWVTEVTFEEDGIVTVTYNNGNIVQYPNIKWITNLELSQDGSFHIDFNNGDEYNTNIIWVRDITTNTDGTVVIEYNDGTSTTYTNLIQWITSVSLSDDGHFVISFNNGTDDYETNLVWVKEVAFEEDGIVTVTYNNGNVVQYPNIKWITNLELNQDGSFHIDFNNGDEYNTNLVWVSSMTVGTDGTVVIGYNDGTSTTYTNLIQWITNVSLTNDGKFSIEFNNGASAYTTDLVWVTGIEIDSSGNITITFNNGDSQKLETAVKWITSVSLTDAGVFTIDFNNGDQYQNTLTWVSKLEIADNGTITITDNHGTATTYDNMIKVLSDVSINTGSTEGTGNQKVHVVYNTGEEEDIGNPLNYIMKMVMVDTDYHLLVWYSDPAKRQEIISEGKSYTYDGEDGWLDLGSVKDESGILVGLNIDQEVVTDLFYDISVAIAYLNQQYPSGLTGTDLQGKVVTIGDDDKNKKFYAYDYDSKTWYYLGTLGGADVDQIVILMSEDDPDLNKSLTNLSVGGLWFVLEG